MIPNPVGVRYFLGIKPPWVATKDNGKARKGGKNSGQKGRKEKEIKFATQEQIQNGYFATYNVVKEAVVTNTQKRYKFGTDIAKSIRDSISFNIKSVKPIREIATLTPPQD